MSAFPINVVDEAQQGRRDISVADAAPGATEIRATGQRGIPVLIAPFQGQNSDVRARGATAQEMSMGFNGFLLLEPKDDDSQEAQRKKWFKEMRGWLMVLATVAASVTYQAGLNPPGGFWQDDGGGLHVAGDPVLHDTHRSRYMIFYYMNATAFVTSLTIMVLLMSERFYHTETKVVALMLTTCVDLISLIGAYIAGTTRFFSSCIYVIVIACVSFVAVIYIGEVMAEICKFFLIKVPCMIDLVQSKWFPVPSEVVRSAQQQREEHMRRAAASNNQRGGCSACCASAPRAEG
ncbi:unnamed protein product [Urochloa decumbens]|uniref:PGG domain-containing protein n=1 Tax=Urochloa decumbens TaxID=240449 RepID=A0ABC9DG60_9POAL